MRFLKIYLMMLLSALVLGGCVSGELSGYFGGGFGDDDESSTKIVISVPDFSHVATRTGATTPYSNSETMIKKCYVVVFSDGGQLKNLANISPDNITQYTTEDEDEDDADTSMRDYTQKEILLDLAVFEGIAQGDRIYVMANYVSYPTSESGLTEDTLNEKFLLNMSGYSATQAGLPMYGMTTKEGARLEVDLKTAVAKMQVKLATTVTGDYGNVFVNTNAGDTNRLMYNLFQWATTTYIDGTTPDAMEHDPIEWADLVDSETEAHNVARSDSDHYDYAIYPYPFPFSERRIAKESWESIKDTEALVDTKFDYRRGCILLVVRVTTGAYKYYRLDLYKDGKYIDVLPNTHYVLTITAVHSDGYDTAKEALMHPPGNIEFNLESSSVQLVSNGQYALSIDEESIKTYLDFTRHPHSPTSQNDNMNLTTLGRVSSEDAVIVPTHGTPFVITLIGATNTTALATGTIQMYRVSNDGTEVACASNTYSGVINEDPDCENGNNSHHFVVKFNAALGTTYNFRYTIEMENINYTSDTYVYRSDYMFNSYETYRDVDIGREIPADVQWNMYGGADLVSGTTYKFSFKTYELWGNSYPSDNSVPDYWVRYTHLGDDAKFVYSNINAVGAIPRFSDKILEGVGHDTKIVIKQARPLYVGKCNGSHYICANYDVLSTTANTTNGYYTPRAQSGSLHTTHINQYSGNGWGIPPSYLLSNSTNSPANQGTSPATILTSDGTAYENNYAPLHSMYRYIYAATSNTTLQYYHNVPRPATLYSELSDDQYYYQFMAPYNYYWSANYGTNSAYANRSIMIMGAGTYSNADQSSANHYCRFVRTITYDY
ncbi:MAG: hypothetical protein SNH79_07185 [Rikenellaceae bacterium]